MGCGSQNVKLRTVGAWACLSRNVPRSRLRITKFTINWLQVLTITLTPWSRWRKLSHVQSEHQQRTDQKTWRSPAYLCPTLAQSPTHFSMRTAALIMVSATPFCLCATQKHLTVKRVGPAGGNVWWDLIWWLRRQSFQYLYKFILDHDKIFH